MRHQFSSSGFVKHQTITYYNNVFNFSLVTSIRCYDCNLCPSAENVIDCNNDTDTPKYDACAKTTFEIDHDGHKTGMYYLTCTVKVF